MFVWRIGIPQTTVTTPFQNLGMAPEGCASYVFPRLLGDRASDEMLTENRCLKDGNEAKDVGFLQELHGDANGLLSYGEDVTRRIIDGSFPGVPMGQRWITRGGLGLQDDMPKTPIMQRNTPKDPDQLLTLQRQVNE